MKQASILFLCLIFLSSCFKEDELIPAKKLTSQVGVVNLDSENGKDYQQQLYFDLSNNQVRKTNFRDEWDLGFSCGPSHPNIFSNYALSMAVAETNSKDINTTFNPDDYEFKQENVNQFFTHGRIAHDFNSDGNPEGTVFLVDLGRTIENKKRGMIKLKVLNSNENSYTIQFADFDNPDIKEATIEKDDTYNNVYISLANPNKILVLEPPKQDWDLLFTRYMERLFDGQDTLDYSVTGALLNPFHTQAAFYEKSYHNDSLNFEDLTYDDLNAAEFTSKTAAIGHDWKYYDLETEEYTVLKDKIYFIVDNKGLNYKLHFTGFYDEAGNKGSVTFEFLQF